MEALSQAIYKTCDTVFKQRDLKIDEQAQLKTTEPEIGEKDLAVNRSKHVNRFQFYDDFVLNNQICAKAEMHLDAFINYGNSVLPDI